jgi:hypothetical protein
MNWQAFFSNCFSTFLRWHDFVICRIWPNNGPGIYFFPLTFDPAIKQAGPLFKHMNIYKPWVINLASRSQTQTSLILLYKEEVSTWQHLESSRRQDEVLATRDHDKSTRILHKNLTTHQPGSQLDITVFINTVRGHLTTFKSKNQKVVLCQYWRIALLESFGSIYRAVCFLLISSVIVEMAKQVGVILNHL